MALCCCSWMVLRGFISVHNDRLDNKDKSTTFFNPISEVRRKDTNVMICHHIATIFLITFSLGMRFWQIGCLVLFCHDICDIFLDASKIFVYIQNRPGASNSTKIICEVVKTLGFVCFVLSWILFRFHFYPRKALYSVIYHRQVRNEFYTKLIVLFQSALDSGWTSLLSVLQFLTCINPAYAYLLVLLYTEIIVQNSDR